MERVRLAAGRIDYITGLEVVDHHRRVAMQTAQRFRLTRSAMAIAQREERHAPIMIPGGATIDVMDGPFNGTRLMNVRYDGEMILMFTDDRKTHTEPLEK